ncbi:hypothetical protein SAMN05421541_105167 [Actinoplanes philippinensis]|uniref:Uncharacterized protein n=2 Tax=Actinoplanes philippinensis TaxID=35752 RepID=A0A1I2F8B2_9ACTN|nr:hypothetical protein SAMN05421541_105167 [Actinoplanes philippinensis]
MGAVEAGHGGAYPLMAGTNPQPGTPHPAGPPPAPERLRTHRAALLAVLAILAALVVVEALVLWRR